MKYLVQRARPHHANHQDWESGLDEFDSIESAKKAAEEMDITLPEPLRIVNTEGRVCGWVARNGYRPNSGGLAPEEELPTLGTITILFGEMGTGKSFYGKILAEQTCACFLEGDSLIPPEMLARAKSFRPIPREMIQDYVHHHLAASILKWVEYDFTRDLVVAQALYSDEDRRWLYDLLTVMGYQVEMIWVKPPFWRTLRQLWGRPDSWRWCLYYLASTLWFQRPTHPHKVIK